MTDRETVKTGTRTGARKTIALSAADLDRVRGAGGSAHASVLPVRVTSLSINEEPASTSSRNAEATGVSTRRERRLVPQ